MMADMGVVAILRQVYHARLAATKGDIQDGLRDTVYGAAGKSVVCPMEGMLYSLCATPGVAPGVIRVTREPDRVGEQAGDGQTMRILIDYTAAITQGAGIGRYTRNLVDSLLRVDAADQYTLFSAQRPSPQRGFPCAPNARAVTGPLDNRRMTMLWHRLRAPLPIEALAGRADVLHAPDFSLAPTLGTPAVVTIHDLAYITNPECAAPSLREYLHRVVPRALRRAREVIAVSRRTAEDLTRLLDVAPERISVIYLGIDPHVRRVEDGARLAEVAARYGLRRPFTLAVGTIEPRKNYERLIEAFAKARRQAGGPQQLVIAGRRGWLYDGVFAAVGRLGLGDAVSFLDYVPDADLPALYSLAEVVTMPSLYEGFGIPVIEAMACGTPVIAGNAGSLPEIAGDAAVLVDPLDVDGLAEALRHVVSDQRLRQQLSAAGLARAGLFDWTRAAQEHLAVYGRAAKTR